MKRALTSLTLFVLLAGLLAFGPGQSPSGAGLVTIASEQSRDDSSDLSLTRHCSARTLKGRYGVSATGTIAGIGPVGFVGWADFDGVGNITGADWASFNGAVSFRSTTGTYTVNEDCTGAVTFVSPTRNIEVHFGLVLVDGGKEVLFIETDPRTVITGVLKRL